MTTTSTQQVALDNALIPLKKQVKIDKCNLRIDPTKTQKEPTYQVVLDALALTTCYLAFLIIIDVPEIYMQQFWFTINKKDLTTYRFKSDKKGYRIDLEVFKEIFQICPRIPNQDFDELPPDEKDSVLGRLRFVSKSNNFQVYGALHPNRMTNQQIRDSTAYKTYLAYATSAESPKMKRKFKKPASPSKKKALVTIDEPVDKHVKKPAAKRQFIDVRIQDTPGVSVSKKKASAKAERSKGIDFLSEAALLKEAQVKKFLKKRRREANIHQADGSSEGAGFESEVPDEPKGKSTDISEGTRLKPRVLDVSKADSYENEYESWGDSDYDNDEDDQHGDDERTESDNLSSSDNEELYSDVNVSLTDAEPADKEKDDEEITISGHENVNQEVVVPLQSSSISSDYAAKLFNFDNVLSVDTEVVSMLDINVQHEVPRTSPLITIYVLSNLEKEVKMLKEVDHKSEILVAIKFEVPTIVKEYLRTSLDDYIHKVIQRHTTKLIEEHSILSDVIDVLK
ncbi:hypothetical protein Tco_0694136 [Tanacetum coccineum]